jgi:hypothetical protein
MRSNAIANISIHPNTLRPEREISSTVGVFAQADKNTYGIADILVVVPEKPPWRQRQTIGITLSFAVFQVTEWPDLGCFFERFMQRVFWICSEESIIREWGGPGGMQDSPRPDLTR